MTAPTRLDDADDDLAVIGDAGHLFWLRVDGDRRRLVHRAACPCWRGALSRRRWWRR